MDMWVCSTGTRHSKSLERRCQRTACLRGEAKCTVKGGVEGPAGAANAVPLF